LDWVLKKIVAGADLVVARVCAERGLRVLLTTSVGVDVGVDVCGAHSVGVVSELARIALRKILLDDHRRKRASRTVVSKSLLRLWRCAAAVAATMVVDDVVNDEW
jgi:hypothetical protein